MSGKDKDFAHRVSVGGATLIMIFAILCLMIFSALSITTALAEKSSSQKFAKTTKEYYAADWKAREIAEVIKKFDSDGMSADEIIKRMKSKGTDIHMKVGEFGMGYIYSVKLNTEGSCIDVEIKKNSNGNLEIASFTQNETSKWQPDEDLELILE